MSKYIFLYKENTDDRDCCAYIEPNPMRWECNHYFGGVTLHGACYCGHRFAPYENIKTILTEDEYNQLVNFNKEINELGFGIIKGDEKYDKGVKLCNAIQPVYDKLLSIENEELFNEVIEEEKEYLMDEYNLSKYDIETIFDNYDLDYRDRAVVGYVYDDTNDLGYETAWSLGYIDRSNSIIDRYFNFEQFGEDLVNDDECYLKLNNGRCVHLMY